jgi:hypothetical protein
VCAAPFAHALPRGVLRVLAVGDSYARRSVACETERAFAFARVEAELYQLFDLVLFTTEDDAARARRHGVKGARHVPLWVREPVTSGMVSEEHDITVVAGARCGELEDLEWFYRHVYLPHLRACGARLTVAGPVAERFGVNDRRVAKVPNSDCVHEASRVVVAPAHGAAGPCAPVLDAMARGRAVVTTPHGLRGVDVPAEASVCIDMRANPAGTAEAVRALLASPARRADLGARAASISGAHARGRYFAAMRAAWQPRATRATAEVA